jgi:hypothetical protein
MSPPTVVFLAIAATVLSACQPSAQQPASSASPTSTSTPVATASAGSASTKALVLVSAAPNTAPDLLLYDPSTNTSKTLLRSQAVERPRFVSADRISYLLDYKLMVRDLSSQRTEIVNEVGGLTTYAWAPGGSVFYLVDGMDGDSLLMGSGSTAKELASWKHGVSSPEPVNQFEVEFSKDARYFFAIATFAAGPALAPETRRLQVRRADGELAFAPPDTSKSFPSASQPLWSATKDLLYFQEADGIHAWDADSGTESLRLPGIHWYHPSASPGGQYIAYSTLDATGVPSIAVYDLKREIVVSMLRLAWSGVFVTADMLLYREQSPCPQASCGAIRAQSTGKVVAYHLSTGKAVDLPFGNMVVTPNGVGAFTGDSPAVVWTG